VGTFTSSGTAGADQRLQRCDSWFLPATHAVVARLAESSRHPQPTPKGPCMLRNTPHISPVASRKQLLIAESELNRAQLSEEWRLMADGVRTVGHRARSITGWASSAVMLVAGVAALRRGPPVPGSAKSSWFHKILNVARVASTIWVAFRARGGKQEHK